MKYALGSTVLLSLLLCSCGILESSAEKSYLGQWRAVQEDQTIGLTLEPNHRCVLTTDDDSWVGKWTVQKSEITITVTGVDRVKGFINSAGDLILVTPISRTAVVFKKASQ